MSKNKKEIPELGIYINICAYGKGKPHTIFAKYDIPLDKAQEVEDLLNFRPDLFVISED